MVRIMFSRCTALAYGDVCPGLFGLCALAAMVSDGTEAPRCCRCAAAPSRARGLQPMTAVETAARFPGGLSLPRACNGHRLESLRDSKGREPVGRRRHFPWRNCAAVSIGEGLVPLDTKQGLCLRHKPLSSCGGRRRRVWRLRFRPERLPSRRPISLSVRKRCREGLGPYRLLPSTY